MGRGGVGRGGEGANKVLQPAQSVRLRASIIIILKQTLVVCNHQWTGIGLRIVHA